MTPRRDMTRWNRAALSRFRYVDGNAVSWLEELRLAHLVGYLQSLPRAEMAEIDWWRGLFADLPDDPAELAALDSDLSHARAALKWQTLWRTRPEESESDAARLERLVEDYETRRPDQTSELARAVARVTHVLTEALDAYANEGYIRTATQWDNLRGLADMIAYAPAPPASASTTVALIAKEAARGLVERGLQAKYIPPEGGKPLIFETLSDLEVDARLNELRLAGWDHHPMTFDPFDQSGAAWRAVEDGLKVGQVAVLVGTGPTPNPIATRIDGLTADTAPLLRASDKISTSVWVRGDTSLWAVPTTVRTARLKGDNVAVLTAAAGLAVGSVVAWYDAGWQFAEITALHDKAVILDRQAPGPGEALYLMTPHSLPDGNAKTAWQVPKTVSRIAFRGEGDTSFTTWERSYTGPLQRHLESGVTVYLLANVTDSSVDMLYLMFDGQSAIATVTEQTASDVFEFDGAPEGLATGDWMVGEDDAGELYPVSVARIEEREDSCLVTFDTTAFAGALPEEVARFHGPLSLEIFPQGHDRNPVSIRDLSRPFILEGGAEPSPLLKKGRLVLLEKLVDGVASAALKTTIVAVESTLSTGGAVYAVTIDVDAPSEDLDAFDLGSTVIRGNVVSMGHGETKGPKVLGSGDATQNRQTFVLDAKDIAFVADRTIDAGVRAEIGLSVGGRFWREVSLYQPIDLHDFTYRVGLTEAGTLRITLDQRVATGVNNVRVEWRREGVGTGANGVPPGGLKKPAKKHYLVERISQPLETAGGSDREPVASLRESAPASVRALSRAVSITDYQDLARLHSSVWQARSFPDPTVIGREERVIVVVVPAEGGALGDLREELIAYLQERALPGRTVDVQDYEKVRLHLDVTITVDSAAYDPDEIEDATLAALRDAFSLEKRGLSQDLFIADVLAVAESVTGVSNVSATILPTTVSSGGGTDDLVERVSRGVHGDIRAVRVTDRQLLCLDEDSTLTVVAQEFEL
jgi:Baseplate J-like protein